MTEERMQRYQELGNRLTQVIIWSIENREEWIGILYPENMASEAVSAVLTDCEEQGFMELYLAMLMRISMDIGVKTNDIGQYIKFLEICIHKHYGINFDEIRKKAAPAIA